MPFVTTLEMLKAAQAGHYAVGAFNVENMEMAQAIIGAAQEMQAPVILQTTPSTLRYATPEMYCAMVSTLAKEATVPVAMHLDHGDSYALCARAFRAGYTSIMIDGSKLPLEENIALTRSVVELCGTANIPVEGELGRVGGKEDDLVCENAGYTDPQEAVRFEKETGLSSMAVGIGTAHGIYKETPVLNVDLVEQLDSMLTVPMVMHGASGLTDEAITDCIARGICKVNFATELRIAYTNAVRKLLAEKTEAFDPKAYGKVGREAVAEVVRNRIRVCGCAGKA